MTETVTPLSRTIDTDTLPDTGTVVKFTASAEECAALAAFYDVPAVTAFSAEVLVKPWRAAGVSVSGHVTATIEQVCVVTLEPVTNTVNEDIDLRFLPAEDLRAFEKALSEDVDPLAEDPPEELVESVLDVGAIAAEHFALGIDPYPRKPGVRFGSAEDGEGDPDGKQDSPFAVLQKLRSDD